MINKQKTRQELLQEISELKSKMHDKYAGVNQTYAESNNTRHIQQPLWDISSGRKNTTVSFQSYTKSDILQWLQSPETYEKSLRDISIEKYNTSTQYKRLINHLGGLLLWNYTLSPTKQEVDTADKESIKKAYTKALKTVENWNLQNI